MSDVSFGRPGNLKFEPSLPHLRHAESLVQRIREGEPVSKLLPVKERSSHRLPLVVFSDFEPDDLMAIGQLWHWKAQHLGLAAEGARPVIIMMVDFTGKDAGTVFEKKLLMARLMLGLEPYTDFQIIAHAELQEDRAVHPLAQTCVEQTSAALQTAAQEIASLADDPSVDFYVLAPGLGLLGALLRLCTQEHADAMARFRTRCRVIMYTGQFNTRSTRREDFEALCQLVSSMPIVDISRFIFFGGADAHPMTESADTFLSPTFIAQLTSRSPLLAAVVQSFNEEFNGYLICPANHRLFCAGKVKDARDDAERYHFDTDIAPLFEANGVRAYCAALASDEGLWQKVAGFKKSTVRAFANGTCDMPLCDQVCFIYEWLRYTQAASISEGAEGSWWVDPESGYSGVGDSDHPHTFGTPALQPKLAEPMDETVLLDVRTALEEHLLLHLDARIQLVGESAVESLCGHSG